MLNFFWKVYRIYTLFGHKSSHFFDDLQRFAQRLAVLVALAEPELMLSKRDEPGYCAFVKFETSAEASNT